MRWNVLWNLGLAAVVFAACEADSEPEPAIEAEPDQARTESEPGQPGVEATATRVTGGGPVIQVIPGPASTADSAESVIAKMPAEMQQQMRMMAEKGPFSDTVARIAGEFRATFWDVPQQQDSVQGEATFTSQDGAQWRVVVNRVKPEGTTMEPTFGGVATNLVYHGATGIHSPLVPTIRSVVSYWGMSEVYRNGQLVSDQAPTHIMLTSDTREDDRGYTCWRCMQNPIEQLHLMYQVPGEVIHVMWEKSQYEQGPVS